MKKTATKQPASVENVFQLEGRVPLLKAIPFGLQHILAMFVANLSPIAIVAAAAGLDNATLAILLQNAMIAAGLATFIQLYPVWKKIPASESRSHNQKNHDRNQNPSAFCAFTHHCRLLSQKLLPLNGVRRPECNKFCPRIRR